VAELARLPIFRDTMVDGRVGSTLIDLKTKPLPDGVNRLRLERVEVDILLTAYAGANPPADAHLWLAAAARMPR
jgi:hypothetical protein